MIIHKTSNASEKEEIIDQAHSVYGQLSSDGYSVIPNIVSKAKCKELIEVLNQLRIDRENSSTTNHTESTKEERWFIEATGQILLRDCLLDRPDVFLEFINCPLLMSVLDLLFGEMPVLDGFSASTTYDRDPRYSHPPKIHIDSRLATPEIVNTTHLVTMICLDDFTESTGGLRVWPGSHKSGIVVHKDYNFDDFGSEGVRNLHPPSGSLVFFLGQTWHQIGTSCTNATRWGLLLTHTRWWIKSQTDYTLCGEEMFSLCTKEQKSLLGFASITPKNRFVKSKSIIPADNIPSNYHRARSWSN
ncbi:phytanoyl-CoA dioxygenase family protein [Gammaproteobacteria bacterium]|nr:phytanoyl-CoA dioxygenase family protein [Gammaproteobacteria bacterium]